MPGPNTDWFSWWWPLLSSRNLASKKTEDKLYFISQINLAVTKILQHHAHVPPSWVLQSLRNCDCTWSDCFPYNAASENPGWLKLIWSSNSHPQLAQTPIFSYILF